MSSETVTAQWLGDQAFLLKDHNGFPIVMAKPNGAAGADLLPLSLIGCIAWDVAAILKKQRKQVTRLEVSAECRRDEAPPWQFRSILITYRLHGQDLSEDRVRKAIELAQEKYCSVYVTLRPTVAITYAVELST